MIGQPDAQSIEMDRIVFKRRKPDDPMAADAEPGPAKPAVGLRVRRPPGPSPAA